MFGENWSSCFREDFNIIFCQILYFLVTAAAMFDADLGNQP